MSLVVIWIGYPSVSGFSSTRMFDFVSSRGRLEFSHMGWFLCKFLFVAVSFYFCCCCFCYFLFVFFFLLMLLLLLCVRACVCACVCVVFSSWWEGGIIIFLCVLKLPFYFRRKWRGLTEDSELLIIPDFFHCSQSEKYQKTDSERRPCFPHKPKHSNGVK